MAHPTPLQMARFWRLVTEGRITDMQFEEMLQRAEPPHEERRTWTPTGDLSTRDQRMRLDAAGTSYLDVLAPRNAGDRGLTRVHNALKRFHVYPDDPTSPRYAVDTIRKLVSTSEFHVLRCKNMGPATLEHLKEILRRLDLSLGMLPEEIERAFGPDVAPAQVVQDGRAQRLRLADADESYLDVLLQGGKGGLFVRVANVVRYGDARDVRSIKDLVALTGEELLKWPHFGPRSLRYLNERLASFGLRLGMSPPEIEEAFRPDPLTTAAAR